MNPLEFFVTFLKASLFSTGGYGNLPSLHQDLIGNHVAVEANFVQAIAVGQISPGPNGLWAISLGYLTYGWFGALLALCALMLPPLLVLVVAAGYNRIAGRPAVEGTMRGISLSVTGLMIVVAVSLIGAPTIDWRGYIIAAVAFGLAATKHVNILIILALAAITGLIFF